MKKHESNRDAFLLCTILFFSLIATACGPSQNVESGPGNVKNVMSDRLKALEDREEIRQLLVNYGRYLDQRNFASFANLFAEKDGEWIGGMGRAKGRDTIRQLMEEEIGGASEEIPAANFHLFMNEHIDLDGDSASATTKWVFMLQNTSGRPEPLLLGHYEDELVRGKEGWRFLRRRVYADIPGDDELK